MRFFEVTAGDDVVEDHRNAKRAELNRLSGRVLQLEAQDEPAVFDDPRTCDLQWNISRQRGRQISSGQSWPSGVNGSTGWRDSAVSYFAMVRNCRREREDQISEMVIAIRARCARRSAGVKSNPEWSLVRVPRLFAMPYPVSV